MSSMLPVVLVDNGSRRPGSALALRKVATALSDRLNNHEVLPASLGYSDSIPASKLGGQPARCLVEVLQEIKARGESGAIVAPLFLGPSASLSRVLDVFNEKVRASTGTVDFDVYAAPCLVNAGSQEDSRLAQMLAAHVRHTAKQENAQSPLKVLVVDHGTPSSAVNAVRARLTEELRVLLGDEAIAVGPASMERREGSEYDFNKPLLEDALAFPPFDSGDVILAMAFLLPGRHAGEDGDVAHIVQRLCDQAEMRGDSLRVHTTPLLGTHALLVDVLADRIHTADRTAEAAPPAGKGGVCRNGVYMSAQPMNRLDHDGSSEGEARSTLRSPTQPTKLNQLRGGNVGGTCGSRRSASDRAKLHGLADSLLDSVEQGVASLRSKLKDVPSTSTMGDAAAAGFTCGFICGSLLVGDPTTLGLAGAAAFSFAHRWPEHAHPRLCTAAAQCTVVVARARARICTIH